MEPRTQKLLTLLGVVLVLLAGGWYVFSSQETNVFNLGEETENGAPTDAVARVNGEEITRAQMDALGAQTAAQQQIDPSSLNAKAQAQFDAQILTTLISQTLLYQAANEANLSVASDEVQAQLDAVKEQFETAEAFEAALTAQGMTQTELESQIHSELSLQAYVDEQANLSSITVSEEEIAAAYEQAASQGEVEPLQTVHSQVEAALIQQKQQEAVATLIEGLRAEADIEVLIEL